MKKSKKKLATPKLVLRRFADGHDDRPAVVELFKNLKANLPQLKELLDAVDVGRSYEDYVYRFYHQSFKVYWLQQSTTKIVDALKALAPDAPLNEWFMQIVAEGMGKRFEDEHNKRWLVETRPIVEAFFHARYFLDMAVKYGQKLKRPPQLLPSGWAALLYLYDLR